MNSSQPIATEIHLMHLVYSFDVGGLEGIVVNCVKSLPDNYKHTIVALTTYSESYAAQLPKNVNIIALHKPAGQSWASFGHFYKLLKNLKPDILHSYNLASLEFQLMAFLARVPYRLHAEHGRDVHDPEGKNKKYQWLRRLVSPFVHQFVSVSDDLHQWMVNVVGLGNKKCSLIRNGVNTERFLPANIVNSNDNDLGTDKNTDKSTDGKLVFGHVARLQAIKNQNGLLSSFAKACEENESFAQTCELVIVGDGPLREALNDQAKKISQQQKNVNISFWGERHDMPTVYKEFDVFVMSSDAEGIPMTMLEAMATGLPVLSTAVGGIPEVTNAEQAMLVEPQSIEVLAQGMLAVFAKRTDLKSMGEQSRERVITEFSQHKMVADYQRLYEQGLMKKGLIDVRN